MRLFPKIDGSVDRLDRCSLFMSVFDVAWISEFANYVCSRSNNIVFGVQDSVFFRMKISLATPRKRRGSGIIFLAKARPTINTSQEIFTLETNSHLLDAGEFVYRSADQLLMLENFGPLSGAMIVDPYASGSPYAIPVEPLDVTRKLFSTIHQDRIPIS